MQHPTIHLGNNTAYLRVEPIRLNFTEPELDNHAPTAAQ